MPAETSGLDLLRACLYKPMQIAQILQFRLAELIVAVRRGGRICVARLLLSVHDQMNI